MDTNEIYTVGDIRAIPDEVLESELQRIENAFNGRTEDVIQTRLLASIARSLARLEAQCRQGGY